MSEDGKAGGKALTPRGPNVFEEVEKSLELKLRGVKGGVKTQIIEQMRKLVEKDPKVFVNNIRRMYESHHDE